MLECVGSVNSWILLIGVHSRLRWKSKSRLAVRYFLPVRENFWNQWRCRNSGLRHYSTSNYSRFGVSIGSCNLKKDWYHTIFCNMPAISCKIRQSCVLIVFCRRCWTLWLYRDYSLLYLRRIYLSYWWTHPSVIRRTCFSLEYLYPLSVYAPLWCLISRLERKLYCLWPKCSTMIAALTCPHKSCYSIRAQHLWESYFMTSEIYPSLTNWKIFFTIRFLSTIVYHPGDSCMH